MAALAAVQIVGIEPNGDNSRVQVEYTAVFDANEFGTKFRLGVKLLPSDPPDDDQPLVPLVLPLVLHTFRWPAARYLWLKRPWVSVTAQHKIVTDVVSNDVPTKVLDEDPGMTTEIKQYGTPIPGWHRDEIRALVTLTGAGGEVTKASEPFDV